MNKGCHYVIHYDYSDARGRKHKMSLSTDNPSESEIIWEALTQVFNTMMRNGALTHFSGFTDTTERGKSCTES